MKTADHSLKMYKVFKVIYILYDVQLALIYIKKSAE